MIKTLADKQTAALFQGLHVRQIGGQWVQVAREKLAILHAADSVEDLRIPPGNHLEALKGGRQGQWSIRINQQWRICFRFENGNAHDVEITDYH
jgi:proteic killer suppression protein